MYQLIICCFVAGVSQDEKQPLHKTPFPIIKRIIETNLIGTVLGCRAAMDVMVEQGYGDIFNMDGAGSTGMATSNFAAV